MDQSDIGVYGLGVMGRNLALNLEEQGHTVSIYNRMEPREEGVVRAFLEQAGKGKKFIGSYSARYFVQSIKKPRKILIMVKAGKPVDQVIQELKPLLSEGDIVIDGGNSHFSDTKRRVEKLKPKGIRFVGMGVSGGEEGARKGPSLMPGGDRRAWKPLQPILESIAAKTEDGQPCCTWMGEKGAGHFVKMVHNGIEYAIMQLLAESYHLMREGFGMDMDEIGTTFRSWNEGELNSYLLEVTADVFDTMDEDGNRVLDYILDVAGQKGTGRWTATTALDMGVPLPLITSAVYARSFSAFKTLREEASSVFTSDSSEKSEPSSGQLTDGLRQALLVSVLVAYAEGFSLIEAANNEWEWDIPLSRVGQTWQAGCIIRSALLGPITATYRTSPDLPHLLLSPQFKQLVADSEKGWRNTVEEAIKIGIPVPAFSTALAYFDSLRSRKLPANLIQAQRDYFGAHTYERTDRPRDTFFHTDWKKQVTSS